METRIVTLSADKDSCIGAWSVLCETCPLLPHLKALQEKPRHCMTGIQTGMQGAIPVSHCNFLAKDSLKENGEGAVVVGCSYAAV